MAKAMKRYNKEVTVIEMMDEEDTKPRHAVDRRFVEETTTAMTDCYKISTSKRMMKSRGMDITSSVREMHSRKAAALSCPV